MKFQHALFGILLTASPLLGDEGSDQKLDRILAELQKLNATVAQLQERVSQLEGQVEAVPEDAVVVVPSSQMAEAGAGSEENLIDRVVDAMQYREQKVVYPWMEETLWSQLEEGMSPDEVVAILGEPTLDDPSLKRWIDTVYTYRGRRPSTNELVTGKVRFYKGKLVNFEAP